MSLLNLADTSRITHGAWIENDVRNENSADSICVSQKIHDLESVCNSGYRELRHIAVLPNEEGVAICGTLTSYWMKQIAQSYAQRIAGCGRVQNMISVVR